jgi:hypothetical protein
MYDPRVPIKDSIQQDVDIHIMTSWAKIKPEEIFEIVSNTMRRH